MKDTKVKSDQKRNSATMLMTEGKIWKQLLVFAVPLILGNLFATDVQRSGLHYCRQLRRQAMRWPPLAPAMHSLTC